VLAAIFGSIDEAGFAPGWTSERVISIFGSAKLDLTNRPPGEPKTTELNWLTGEHLFV
jgi:hypothetical protein